MKVNVYDFDGTIYDGDSSIDYFLFILKKYPSTLFRLPRLILAFVLYFFRLTTIETFKAGFFRAITRNKDNEYNVENFWQIKFRKIKPFYFEVHQNSDIIISASPDFLLASLIDKLNVSAIVTTIFDLQTLKIVGLNCSGQEKVNRLNSIYNYIQIDNFYSDNRTDEPLAQLSQKAYKVNGLKIIDWDEKENKNLGLLSVDFLRFVFSGAIGTLSNFILSVTLLSLFNPVNSYIFGYSSSLFITYFLNSKFVFLEHLSLNKFIKFTLSYIPNFLILFTFVLVFIRVLDFNPILIYAVAGLLGLPVTFVLLKIYTFKL